MLDKLFADTFHRAEEIGGWRELGIDCCSVRLVADDESVVAQLNSHFDVASSFAPDEHAFRIVIVNRVADDANWHAALRGSESLVNSVLGRGSFPTRWWPPTPGRRAWAAEYSGAGHRILRIENDICVFLNPIGPDTSRYAQRVLREVLIHGGRRRDFLLVHGAVLSLEDRGLIVFGHKGAGKTDMALRLCRRLGGRVVGVDRVLLGVDHRKRMVAVGLPFGLNIALQTWPAIGVPFDAARALGSFVEGKVYIDQQAFSRLTGMATQATSELTGAIVLTQGAGSRLDADQLADSIRAHSLYGRDPGYLHDWLGLAGDRSRLVSEGRIVKQWPLPELAQRSLALQHQAGDDPAPVLETLLR